MNLPAKNNTGAIGQIMQGVSLLHTVQNLATTKSVIERLSLGASQLGLMLAQSNAA